MKKTYQTENVPTANIAVNKSRIKLYEKGVDKPTYYLENNQEFQIEIFNPTSNSVLAKIHLNGNAISQGGLVLKPGERVFLDRYFDVAKKFLFETYEVENTSEVKKAIENNGELKVEFYKESNYQIQPYNQPFTIQPYINPYWYGNGSTSGDYYLNNGTIITSTANNYVGGSNTTYTLYSSSPTIETGRIEKGSYSNQKFQNVNKSFDYFPFHTVEYKLMPISQKINTLEDISVKRYCTNCGHKVKKDWKFCPSCANKI